MKDGKAPGHDFLNREILKLDKELSATFSFPLIKEIWEHQIVPDH